MSKRPTASWWALSAHCRARHVSIVRITFAGQESEQIVRPTRRLGPRAVRARRNAWSCVRSYDKVTRRKAALGRHVGQAPAGRHTRSHKVPGDTGHMPRLPPSRAPSHPPEPRTVCGLQVALHQVRSLGTSSSPAPTDVSNALAAGHRLSNPLNAAATRFQPSSCSYTR